MDNSIAEWRRLVDREGDLINSRASMFLVANGIMAVGVLSSESEFKVSVSCMRYRDHSMHLLVHTRLLFTEKIRILLGASSRSGINFT